MNDYKNRKKMFLEFAGRGRYEITATFEMPDGNRLIDVGDRHSNSYPITYVQSEIHDLPYGELRNFLFRHIRLIQDGIYDV
ncbi:hypothetical protein J0K78_16985 [Halobacillus sp. GSS1]|uniref:hypothetical protein n=1 Tax=Halobacillus sp. GSS1 TaxID=2815919 RepID=UPI001A8D3655|nr:hypothetical protein [Halobacillus sp. GSS1]MBN9655973.1 hypothetical protein [Halobacillus sp. GSS1]